MPKSAKPSVVELDDVASAESAADIGNVVNSAAEASVASGYELPQVDNSLSRQVAERAESERIQLLQNTMAHLQLAGITVKELVDYEAQSSQT